MNTTGRNVNMVKCALCGEKAGIFTRCNLKYGKCCGSCYNRFIEAGIKFESIDDLENFTSLEAKKFLDDPERWNNIIKERREHRKKTTANCLICGKSLDSTYKYITRDAYALCASCRGASITISPEVFLNEKDEFIERHDSDFFKKHMEHLENPHPSLYVNFTNQRFYYAGQLITDVTCVFSFDSVLKIESDTETYEVTVGKKGHPIARAVAGGMIFGGAGAVVGAMTAKNTRHKEEREGKKYICIYHKDPTNPDTILKRMCYCNDDGEIVKLEECLKRVFEYREAEQQKQEVADKETKSVESSNNYGELVELKKLLDMGVITQEEFDTKKKQILGL